jgi:hypothetical protein
VFHPLLDCFSKIAVGFYALIGLLIRHPLVESVHVGFAFFLMKTQSLYIAEFLLFGFGIHFINGSSVDEYPFALRRPIMIEIIKLSAKMIHTGAGLSFAFSRTIRTQDI